MDIDQCKGIQDMLGFSITFRIPFNAFRRPGAAFQSLSVGWLGFWILIVGGIPDSLSCILDSKAQDSGFHKQNFPEIRILQAKISQIPDFRFPYMEQWTVSTNTNGVVLGYLNSSGDEQSWQYCFRLRHTTTNVITNIINLLSPNSCQRTPVRNLERLRMIFVQ